MQEWITAQAGRLLRLTAWDLNLKRVRLGVIPPIYPAFTIQFAEHSAEQGLHHVKILGKNRFWPVSLLAAGVLMMSGCETTAVSNGRKPAEAMMFRREERTKAPPSADVPRMEAWRDAEALSAREEGPSSAVGSGESMAPVFGGNTLLVLSRI